MSTPKDRLTRFLEHLDSIFQVEPEFFPYEPESPDAPKVVCMAYADIPEPGFVTGVTHGLSEVAHKEWKFGRPELIISVESTDLAWAQAIGYIVNNLRGHCPFSYGDIINFQDTISDASEMTSFVVFAPAILNREHFLDIDVGGEQPLNIAGMYPIYESEAEVIGRVGLEKFWHHPNFDLFDVNRPPVEIEDFADDED